MRLGVPDARFKLEAITSKFSRYLSGKCRQIEDFRCEKKLFLSLHSKLWQRVLPLSDHCQIIVRLLPRSFQQLPNR